MKEIKKLIEEKYRSESMFGLRIGFTPQKVGKMLKGEYTPKLSEAQKIADALGLTLDETANFFNV